MIKYQSTYHVNGGNDLITILRDQDGNAVSGTILTREDQPNVFQRYDMKNFDFNAVKAWFQESIWSFVGTEKADDGRTLNKMMQSYQSYISDTTQANMQLIVFLDADTGLPVKEELYEDSTGQYKLFSTDTSEYQYVGGGESLFKPDEVTLVPVNYNGNAN